LPRVQQRVSHVVVSARRVKRRASCRATGCERSDNIDHCFT
jgi:hypothetical protein